MASKEQTMQQEIRKRDQMLAQAEADMGDLLASKESEKAWFMQAVLYTLYLSTALVL